VTVFSINVAFIPNPHVQPCKRARAAGRSAQGRSGLWLGSLLLVVALATRAHEPRGRDQGTARPRKRASRGLRPDPRGRGLRRSARRGPHEPRGADRAFGRPGPARGRHDREARPAVRLRRRGRRREGALRLRRRVPEPPQASKLVREADSDRDLHPMGQNYPSFSFTVVGDLPGGAVKAEEGRMDVAVTDAGDNLVPDDDWKRRISFPKLTSDRRSAFFDVELRLGDAPVEGFREIRGRRRSTWASRSSRPGRRGPSAERSSSASSRRTRSARCSTSNSRCPWR